jgi:DNA-binding MarR family transcriptional regulator
LTGDREDDPDRLDLVAYVKGSRYRELILSELFGGPKQPSEIAEAGDVARPHVSRGLSELSDRGVVQSHGGDSRATLYSLTDEGREIAKEVIAEKK